MLPLKMDIGDATHLGVQRGIQRLDEGGLAHAGFTRQEDDLSGHIGPQDTDPLSRDGRGFDDRIARPLVDMAEGGDFVGTFIPVHIHLVQYHRGRDAIDLAGY